MTDAKELDRILVLGERFNAQGKDYRVIHRWESQLLSGEMTPHEYWYCMTYCGALKTKANRSRLAAIGVQVGEFSDERVWAVNLLAPAEQGEAWPLAKSRDVLRLLWAELFDEYRVIIVCGMRLRCTFGLDHEEWFSVHDVDGYPDRRVMIVPHPSGLSRFWNDKEAVARGRSAVDRLIAIG